MSKPYHSQAEQKQMCKEYRESGKTQKAFCAAKGISLKTLSRWLTKERSMKLPMKFVPVGELRQPLGLAEIILPNEIRIKLQIEVEKISLIARDLLSCK